jgi:hypothetical protein
VDVFNSRNGFIRFATNSTERARIDSNGNLLVGTTSAFFNSAGRGLLEMNGSSESLLALKSNNTVIAYLQATSTQLTILASSKPMTVAASGANNVLLNTNGTDRVNIKSAGQVRFVPLTADPTVGVEDGDVYYNSTTNKLRVRAGGAWVDLH